MYTLIGGDGKEYGPVSTAQIRAWMADGRANAASRIRAEGSDEWKTIGDFPELTGPQAAPGNVAPEVATPAMLNIISCYERSWELLKREFWPLVGISALMLVLFAAVLVLENVFLYGYLVSLLVTGVVNGGCQYFFLRKARGGAAPTRNGGTYSASLGALTLAGILITIFTLLGLVPFVIPGIYLLVAYSFAYLLAIDRGLSAWRAMETSRKTITRQWFPMLGLILLGVVLNLAGVLALGIGIFVTVPVSFGALVYAYEDLCVQKH